MKPLSTAQARYIASLRTELGIKTAKLPGSAREGHQLIDSLLQRKEVKERAAERERIATAPPSDELRMSIERVAARLGIEVDVPLTNANARFVLDDLYHRERKSRRIADGSVR